MTFGGLYVAQRGREVLTVQLNGRRIELHPPSTGFYQMVTRDEVRAACAS
jgi:hypothetical protein